MTVLYFSIFNTTEVTHLEGGGKKKNKKKQKKKKKIRVWWWLSQSKTGNGTHYFQHIPSIATAVQVIFSKEPNKYPEMIK